MSALSVHHDAPAEARALQRSMRTYTCNNASRAKEKRNKRCQLHAWVEAQLQLLHGEEKAAVVAASSRYASFVTSKKHIAASDRSVRQAGASVAVGLSAPSAFAGPTGRRCGDQVRAHVRAASAAETPRECLRPQTVRPCLQCSF